MNPDLGRLQPYPFEKLTALTQDLRPPPDIQPIALSIGEPKHLTPALIRDTLIAHLHLLSAYPSTRGIAPLREQIADWLHVRFKLSVSALAPEQHILPLNGTREGLFAVAQALIDRTRDPLVILPNPFYQIYEGAALLAGAQPSYLSCDAANGFIPDFEAIDAATWKRCQLLYVCSPANPTGAVFDTATFSRLIELAHRYDFIIVSDECYSELYCDEKAPPLGLLQVAAAIGNDRFERCLAFHSLSKRSNAPGMRSGFVAGDGALIEQFFAYRTYHGCAMPLPHQHASIAAWSDEVHVRANRARYRDKFSAVLNVLGDCLSVQQPAGGFYLWPETPIDDLEFTRRLYAEEHLTVLPGSFLSRTVDGRNPGANRIRLALVPPFDACVDAAWRIRRCIERL